MSPGHEVLRPLEKYPDPEIFNLSQLTLQGAEDTYLVILEKNGITDYQAVTASGKILQRAIPGAPSDTGEQKIYDGKGFAVFAVTDQERVTLHLGGNGRPGKIVIVTPVQVSAYRYPFHRWRASLLLAGGGIVRFQSGDRLALESEGNNENTGASKSPMNVSGVWTSNFGTLTLVQEGNIVKGYYTHDNGKIVGFLKGNVFVGKWSEAPTYRPRHDAGSVRLIFSDQGQSFKGHWRYGFGGNAWNGDWTGKKVK